MSTFLQDFQTQAASAFTSILKELGEQLTYSNKSNAPVTLWGSPNEQSRALATVAHTSAEETTITFDIPRQTNFPPTNGPAIGDLIVYQTFSFWVQSWDADTIGAVYAVKCKRQQAARVGGM